MLGAVVEHYEVKSALSKLIRLIRHVKDEELYHVRSVRVTHACASRSQQQNSL
jgi:hypothetical protein